MSETCFSLNKSIEGQGRRQSKVAGKHQEKTRNMRRRMGLAAALVEGK